MGNAIKPAIVADYNRHMRHADNADRMANSYTASRRTWKWTKKAFFPPVGPGHCQQLRPLIFMWWEENLTQRFSAHPYQRSAGTGWGGDEPRPSMPLKRPTPSATNTGRLDTRHSKAWSESHATAMSRVFSERRDANGDGEMCQV